MKIEYNEKGKFFTDVVPKRSLPVIIQTVHQLIRGEMHIRPEQRVIDEINLSEKFIALTEATVFDEGGGIGRRTAFMSVNRDHIVWIIPIHELIEEGKFDLGEGRGY